MTTMTAKEKSNLNRFIAEWLAMTPKQQRKLYAAAVNKYALWELKPPLSGEILRCKERMQNG